MHHAVQKTGSATKEHDTGLLLPRAQGFQKKKRSSSAAMFSRTRLYFISAVSARFQNYRKKRIISLVSQTSLYQPAWWRQDFVS